MVKRKRMKDWTEREVEQLSGVKWNGDYSWRKDLRQTFFRDFTRANTPEERKIAWLLRKQAIYENITDDDEENQDEYLYKIGKIKEEIRKLRRGNN